MKLYFSPGACCLCVRIIIHEIGLVAEFENVDLKTKKTQTGEDFLKINPKGAVPVLITDNKETLTENSAILQYLADRNSANNLLPPLNHFMRYQVLEWLSFVSSDVHKSFGPLFNPHIPDEMKNTLFIPALKNKLNFIDQSLHKKTFLAGSEFTLPDAYLYVVLRWLRAFKIDLMEWAHLSRYFQEIEKRQSVQQSLKEEDLL